MGSKAVPPLNPSCKFSAPCFPSQPSIVFKGGGVHFQLPVRANLVTAVAGITSQMLVKPLSDAISDNIISSLMEMTLVRDIPNGTEIRRRQQQGVQDPIVKDSEVDALPKASLEASVMPLNPFDDVTRIVDSSLLEEIMEGVKKPHSPSP